MRDDETHIPPCGDVIEARKDINALGDKVRRLEAVMFGVAPDEMGGIRGDIATVKTWLKALTFFMGILVMLFGPERLITTLKFLK